MVHPMNNSWKEGRKEGRKEGGKEGRKEEIRNMVGWGMVRKHTSSDSMIWK
jgi:cobalamin biosynthesis Mg chelatase CobN